MPRPHTFTDVDVMAPLQLLQAIVDSAIFLLLLLLDRF